MQTNTTLEEILKNSRLFTHLSNTSIQALVEKMPSQQRQAGEVLVRQGEKDTDLYVIVQGSAKVILDDEHGREIILNECSVGAILGELALLNQHPRAATIITTSPVILHKLSRHDFLTVLANQSDTTLESIQLFWQGVQTKYIIQTLKRFDWFAILPDTDLFEIAQQLEVEHFEPQDIVCHQGDTAGKFYIILRGWVSAYITLPEGEKMIIHQLGPSDIFGEIALIDNKPQLASIVALSQIEVLTLERHQFQRVVNKHPLLAQSMLYSLTDKLRFSITYLEKAVAWSQRIAKGDYSMVLDQIEVTQDQVLAAQESDDLRVHAFLSSFFQMVRDLQQREEKLRQEVNALKLKIEFDEQERHEQVQAITQNPFFASLKKEAKKLRRNHQ